MKEYIDTKGLAKKFNIAESTIELLRRNGRIPAFKVGRQFRYDPDKAEEALKWKANS